MNQKKKLGALGEAVAAKYLEGKGLRLIEHNFCSYGGELDLIMWDEARGEWVLVEVKTRRNKAFGHAEEAITPEKIQRMLRAAEGYFLHHKKMDSLPYFRVDGVTVEPQGEQFRCRHFENIAA